MEGNGIYALVAMLGVAISAATLVPRLCSRISMLSYSSRAQSRAVKQGGLLSSVLRNGVSWGKPIARGLFRVKRVRDAFHDASRLASSRGFVTSPENFCSAWSTAVIALAVAAAFVGASALFGIAVAACAAICSVMVAAHAGEKRRDDLCEAIPDALRSMGVCSHAGFSLYQTFLQVADETDGPLKTLFVQASHNLEIGSTAEEALAVLRNHSDVAELSFVAVALDIQHRSGGSLQQVLDSARDSVESGLELKRSLKIQTAQAKLSARIVSAMPFVLVALFSLVSPGFLAPFFESVLGVCLLGIAVSMQVGGILVVRRLLAVEIG